MKDFTFKKQFLVDWINTRELAYFILHFFNQRISNHILNIKFFPSPFKRNLNQISDWGKIWLVTFHRSFDSGRGLTMTNAKNMAIGVASLAAGSTLFYHLCKETSIYFDRRTNHHNEQERTSQLHDSLCPEKYAETCVDGSYTSESLANAVESLKTWQVSYIKSLEKALVKIRTREENISNRLELIESSIESLSNYGKIERMLQGRGIMHISNKSLEKAGDYLGKFQSETTTAAAMIGVNSFHAFIWRYFTRKNSADFQNRLRNCLRFIELNQPVLAYRELHDLKPWELCLARPALIYLKHSIECDMLRECLELLAM